MRFFAFIFASLLALAASGQSNRFYTQQHGLRTSNINSLTSDSKGLLWIASSSEPAFFDGISFHYLPAKNANSESALFTIVNDIKESEEDHYWMATNNGLYDYDARLMNYKRISLSQEEENATFNIETLLAIPGNDRELMVVTSGYGLYYIDRESKSVNKEKSAKIHQALRAGFLHAAYIDHSGRLWTYTDNDKLIALDLNTNKRQTLTITPQAASVLDKSEVNEVLEVEAHGAIYFATNNAILRYTESTNTLDLVLATVGRRYTMLLYTKSGLLLAGTDSQGVWQLTTDGQISPYALKDMMFDLSLGKVRDMVEDVHGNLYVALLQKGIFVQTQKTGGFRFHTISLTGGEKNSSCITSMAIDRLGNYWITTDGAGVFTTTGTHIDSARPVNANLASMLVQTVAIDRFEGVWVGSYGGGVQRYNHASGYWDTPAWMAEMQGQYVMSLVCNKQANTLYAGTNGNGVYEIDLNNQTCRKIHPSNGLWTTALHVDATGLVWVGELGSTAYYNPKTKKSGVIKNELLSGTTKSISSMGSGADRRILIGTTEGLYIYNPADGSMEQTLEGLSVSSIAQTEQELWVTASNQIYSVDKKTLKTANYNSFGGNFVGEFHQGSTLNNGKGNILFGCDNGLLCFTPKESRKQKHVQGQIMFTDLMVAHQSVNYSDSDDYLDANILYATEINLKHTDNSFRLYFAVPGAVSPEQIHYEYLLEGYEKEWNRTSNASEQFAYYSNLSPGCYTLHVKAYLEGLEEASITKEITIYIATPWWDSWWAWCIYLIIIASIGVAAWRFLLARRREKEKLQEALQGEQIREAKLRMFTSITHELRTPLTMIVSPLKQLMTNCNDEQTRRNLGVMKHNCDRLLDIVKQITDIRMIDAGQFRLYFKEVDICAYTRNVSQAFLGVAAQKHITYNMESNESNISAWVDPTHFEKVIVNVLSNAFKFCPDDGSIRISINRNGDTITLSIYNSGPQLSEDDKTHIFERFYQNSEGRKHVGSGIGLNLAYELVQLHHGTIRVDNVQSRGIEFVITLQAGMSHLTPAELEEPPVDESVVEQEKEQTKESLVARVETMHTENNTTEGNTEEEQAETRKTIMVVDDSKDLCEYIAQQLEPYYNVMLAFNGNSAWNMILTQRPDVIITDVKMPGGDGIELCKRIKANPELDHTPIIMLTGEASDALQLESLELHVDHFMQKPFNLDILMGNIRQVLDVRTNLKRHIQRKDISANLEKAEIVSGDDLLFERINQSVQEHLDDEKFTVQQLAAEVGISRVHLNRKMKEKYGLSPNVFIRSYRLKQAAYMLLHKRVNVSEVAYRVGFNTHSYFSSSFREFFGMTPKDFITFCSDPENEDKLEKFGLK